MKSDPRISHRLSRMTRASHRLSFQRHQESFPVKVSLHHADCKMSQTFVHTEPKFILLQTNQVPGGGKRKANAKTGRGHNDTCPSRRCGHKLRRGRRQEVGWHREPSWPLLQVAGTHQLGKEQNTVITAREGIYAERCRVSRVGMTCVHHTQTGTIFYTHTVVSHKADITGPPLKDFFVKHATTHRWTSGWTKCGPYTHSRLSLSLKKEGDPDTCYNMDGPWRRYTECNTPAQAHTIWVHLYRSQIHRDWKWNGRCQEQRGRREGGSHCSMGTVSVWEGEKVADLTVAMVT